MLPRRNGWPVLADLRAGGILTPVFLLTAKNAVHHRVRGLELGADDDLVKPFAFSELPAPVRTVLRRGSERQPDVMRVADLEIDPLRLRAVCARRCLHLTPNEFALLCLFARGALRRLA